MDNAEVHLSDFGEIIVDQADGARIEFALDRKLLADFALHCVLKRLKPK